MSQSYDVTEIAMLLDDDAAKERVVAEQQRQHANMDEWKRLAEKHGKLFEIGWVDLKFQQARSQLADTEIRRQLRPGVTMSKQATDILGAIAVAIDKTDTYIADPLTGCFRVYSSTEVLRAASSPIVRHVFRYSGTNLMRESPGAIFTVIGDLWAMLTEKLFEKSGVRKTAAFNVLRDGQLKPKTIPEAQEFAQLWRGIEWLDPIILGMRDCGIEPTKELVYPLAPALHTKMCELLEVQNALPLLDRDQSSHWDRYGG